MHTLIQIHYASTYVETEYDDKRRTLRYNTKVFEMRHEALRSLSFELFFRQAHTRPSWAKSQRSLNASAAAKADRSCAVAATTASASASACSAFGSELFQRGECAADCDCCGCYDCGCCCCCCCCYCLFLLCACALLIPCKETQRGVLELSSWRRE